MLTGRDITLLKHLTEAKLLDREQIQLLLDFKSITRVNDRLLRLHAAGLLHRYFLGTRAGGRKAIYGLSKRGANTIGHATLWKLQRTEDELLVAEAFVEHQLAVNWCWISMKSGPSPNLERFVCFNEPISPAVSLTPDGYAELNTPSGVQAVFLEVDLGNETSRVWDRKVELYLKLATLGEFERLFHQQRFKVAIVCTSERRIESLRRTVRKHTAKLFYFSLLQTTKREGFRAPLWLRPEGDARESIA
jgi:predicted transcriptional regulator